MGNFQDVGSREEAESDEDMCALTKQRDGDGDRAAF